MSMTHFDNGKNTPMIKYQNIYIYFKYCKYFLSIGTLLLMNIFTYFSHNTNLHYRTDRQQQLQAKETHYCQVLAITAVVAATAGTAFGAIAANVV